MASFEQHATEFDSIVAPSLIVVGESDDAAIFISSRFLARHIVATVYYFM